jgi:hypothetical protein
MQVVYEVIDQHFPGLFTFLREFAGPAAGQPPEDTLAAELQEGVTAPPAPLENGAGSSAHDVKDFLRQVWSAARSQGLQYILKPETKAYEILNNVLLTLEKFAAHPERAQEPKTLEIPEEAYADEVRKCVDQHTDVPSAAAVGQHTELHSALFGSSAAKPRWVHTCVLAMLSTLFSQPGVASTWPGYADFFEQYWLETCEEFLVAGRQGELFQKLRLLKAKKDSHKRTLLGVLLTAWMQLSKPRPGS